MGQRAEDRNESVLQEPEYQIPVEVSEHAVALVVRKRLLRQKLMQRPPSTPRRAGVIRPRRVHEGGDGSPCHVSGHHTLPSWKALSDAEVKQRRFNRPLRVFAAHEILTGLNEDAEQATSKRSWRLSERQTNNHPTKVIVFEADFGNVRPVCCEDRLEVK